MSSREGSGPCSSHSLLMQLIVLFAFSCWWLVPPGSNSQCMGPHKLLWRGGREVPGRIPPHISLHISSDGDCSSTALGGLSRVMETAKGLQGEYLRGSWLLHLIHCRIFIPCLCFIIPLPLHLYLSMMIEQESEWLLASFRIEVTFASGSLLTHFWSENCRSLDPTCGLHL